MMNLSKILLVSVSFMTVLGYSDNLSATPHFIFKRGTAELTSIYTGANSGVFSHTHLSTVSRPQLFADSNLKQSPTLVANVCFVTDTGECRGNEFGAGNSPDPVSPPPGSSGSSGSSSSSSGSSSSGSSSSGSSSSGGDECDPNDAWCIDNQKRCDWEGYLKTLKDCNEVQVPHNYCPYDRTYFEKCVCDPTLISCPSPLQGVGRECNGKYRTCKCPDNFQSCECGPAAGAIACTWNGRTTYSGCKACCTPYSDETGCSCGTYSCSDGCGGTRKCCSSCPSTSSSSGGGGMRIECDCYPNLSCSEIANRHTCHNSSAPMYSPKPSMSCEHDPNSNVTALIACLNRIYFNAKNAFLINLECGVVIRDGYQLPESSFHLTTHTIRASRLLCPCARYRKSMAPPPRWRASRLVGYNLSGAN